MRNLYRDIMYNSNINNIDSKVKHSKKNVAIAVILVIVIFSIIAYVISTNYNVQHQSSNGINNVPINVKLSSAVGSGSYHYFNLTRSSTIRNITLINQLYNLNISNRNITSGVKVAYYGSNSVLELISILNTSASNNYHSTLNHELITHQYSPIYNKTYNGVNYSELYRIYNGNVKSFLILGYYKNYFAVILSTGNYSTSSVTNYTIPALVNIISSQTT